MPRWGTMIMPSLAIIGGQVVWAVKELHTHTHNRYYFIHRVFTEHFVILKGPIGHKDR